MRSTLEKLVRYIRYTFLFDHITYYWYFRSVILIRWYATLLLQKYVLRMKILVMGRLFIFFSEAEPPRLIWSRDEIMTQWLFTINYSELLFAYYEGQAWILLRLELSLVCASITFIIIWYSFIRKYILANLKRKIHTTYEIGWR